MMRYILTGFGAIIFGMTAIWYSMDANTQVSSSTVSGDSRHVFTPVRYLSANTRYRFDINQIQAQIPCATNLRIDQDHPGVTHMILAIHSSSYNPDYYLNNALLVLKSDPKRMRETLIFAPALYRKDKTDLGDIVTWENAPFWGSSRGLFHGEKIRLSAYEILDDILTRIMTSGHFPNLRDIVVLGHSAGGQLLNRYAACNTIEDTVATRHHISMRYLVMAPSSYVYMDGKRLSRNDPTRFDFPFNPYKKYNRWGYGLEYLYGYHKRHHITADKIRLQYRYRRVLYLVGERDTADAALSKTKAAMMQGENRLERLKIYYRYLENHYGEDIHTYQTMAVIEGVGHSSRKLMLSHEGKEFILE